MLNPHCLLCLVLDVYVTPNRKYANLSLIYFILDFSFFMSQDDAYFHIHQNGPGGYDGDGGGGGGDGGGEGGDGSGWLHLGGLTADDCSE